MEEDACRKGLVLVGAMVENRKQWSTGTPVERATATARWAQQFGQPPASVVQVPDGLPGVGAPTPPVGTPARCKAPPPTLAPASFKAPPPTWLQDAAVAQALPEASYSARRGPPARYKAPPQTWLQNPRVFLPLEACRPPWSRAELHQWQQCPAPATAAPRSLQRQQRQHLNGGPATAPVVAACSSSASSASSASERAAILTFLG